MVTECMLRAPAPPSLLPSLPGPEQKAREARTGREKHLLISVRGGRLSVHGELIRRSAGKPSNRQTVSLGTNCAPRLPLSVPSAFDRSDRLLVRDVRWWNLTDLMTSNPTLRLRRPRVPAHSPGVAKRAGFGALKIPGRHLHLLRSLARLFIAS
jgi:hypothetical protein